MAERMRDRDSVRKRLIITEPEDDQDDQLYCSASLTKASKPSKTGEAAEVSKSSPRLSRQRTLIRQSGSGGRRNGGAGGGGEGEVAGPDLEKQRIESSELDDERGGSGWEKNEAGGLLSLTWSRCELSLLDTTI